MLHFAEEGEDKNRKAQIDTPDHRKIIVLKEVVVTNPSLKVLIHKERIVVEQWDHVVMFLSAFLLWPVGALIA